MTTELTLSNTNTNVSANINSYQTQLILFLSTIMAIVVYVVIMLYCYITDIKCHVKEMEENLKKKIQANYCKMRDAHNDNTIACKETFDEVEEKLLQYSEAIKDIQACIKKIEELMSSEEKKYNMQLQKVSQENIKLVQHSSVLFDKTKTMQKQLDNLDVNIKEIDNEYVAVGVVNDAGEPYFMPKNVSYIHGDGSWKDKLGNHCSYKAIKYIILSQLSKMKIDKLEIQYLMNTPFKCTPNDTTITVLNDYNTNIEKHKYLRRMYKYLQKLHIEIILPPDQNYKNTILQIVNN